MEYDETNPDHVRWFGEPNYISPVILAGVDRRNILEQTFDMLKNLKDIYYNEKISKIKNMYNNEKSKYTKN